MAGNITGASNWAFINLEKSYQLQRLADEITLKLELRLAQLLHTL